MLDNHLIVVLVGLQEDNLPMRDIVFSLGP